MDNNPLKGLLPPKVRQVLYALLFVAAQALAIWRGADGDWWLFAANEFAALLGLLAASNVHDPEPGKS